MIWFYLISCDIVHEWLKSLTKVLKPLQFQDRVLPTLLSCTEKGEERSIGLGLFLPLSNPLS